MEARGERWSGTVWVAVLLAAAFAAMQSWRATSLYGLGVDGDAAWTLSAGESLASGRGLVTCLDEVFSLWPPLYPGIMALFHGVGLDVLDALRIVQIAALAATVVLGARLAFEVSGAPLAAVATAGSLALSPQLHEYTVQTVSESLFLPLVLAALLATLRWRQEPNRTRLAWLIAWCAAACLQRYLGVAVVATVVLYLAVAPVGTRRERFARAAVCAAASLLPLAAWLARNRLVEDAWTGGRTDSPQAFASVARDAGATLAGWCAPQALPAWSGVVVAAIASIAGALVLRRRTAGLALAFAGIYSATLVALASIVLVDRVGDRLMLPVLPVAFALGWGAVFAAARTRATTLAAGALAALAWIDTAPALWKRLDFWRVEGAGGFHTRAWQEHPVSRAIVGVDLREPVWSNAPEMVWLATRRNGRFLRPTAKAWARAGAESAEHGGSLVWFQREGKPNAFVESLGRASEPLASVTDGLTLRLPAPRAER